VNHEQSRDSVVRYWWSKAEESLASAQREVEAGALAFAMNRVYYAAFYAVSADFARPADIVQETLWCACCFPQRIYQKRNA